MTRRTRSSVATFIVLGLLCAAACRLLYSWSTPEPARTLDR